MWPPTSEAIVTTPLFVVAASELLTSNFVVRK
jgi:hypothetical protein